MLAHQLAKNDYIAAIAKCLLDLAHAKTSEQVDAAINNLLRKIGKASPEPPKK